MQYNSRKQTKTKTKDNEGKSRKPKVFKSKLHLETKIPNQSDKQQLVRNNCKDKILNTKKSSPRNLSRSNKVYNFKPYALNRFVNKHKTLEQNRNTELKQKSKGCNKWGSTPPYEYRIAHKLKEIIKESHLTKTKETVHVRQVVVKALKEGICWPTIELLLQECGWQRKITKNCFLVQICFRKNVFLLLSIRSKNILQFKKHLLNTLNKYQAKYASILQYFKYNCAIEALASYKTKGQFVNFETNLAKDAIECQAKLVEIIDYETGAVKFQCHPLQLPYMVEKLEKRNYKIFYTDYRFEPFTYKRVNMQDCKEYMKFLKDIKKFQEVENYFDNIEILNET